MSKIIIPGSRQERREEARRALSGNPQTIDLSELIGNIEATIGIVHYRIDVAFEAMRIMGATDETFTQAEKNVKEKLQAQQEKAQIQEVKE